MKDLCQSLAVWTVCTIAFFTVIITIMFIGDTILPLIPHEVGYVVGVGTVIFIIYSIGQDN